MKLVPQTCPLCGSEDAKPTKTFADGVAVGRCRSCGLWYTTRRHIDPAQLFKNTSVNQLRQSCGLILDAGARFYRASIFEHYLATIATFAPGSRLLDIGCAQGFFPALAKDRGWEVVAIEPSPPMAVFASTCLGVDVREGTVESAKLADLVVDAVTFTDSLEYVPNPRHALRLIHERLVPGGIVLIKVPNGRQFQCRHKIEQWLGRAISDEGAFSPSYRVAHYTDLTLARLVEECGFCVVRVESCPPIHSPAWRRVIGVDLMIEAPWFVAPHHRLVRLALHAAGRLEHTVARRDHFSQAILLVARKQG